MLRFERQYWQAGVDALAGVDEAGRGPLAGPVVAAAVVLQRSFAEAEEHGLLNGLTDSKRLSPSRREAFYRILRESPHVAYGVGRAEVEEIDQVNILQATYLAMARAVEGLPSPPVLVLVDGLPVKGLPCDSRAIVRGDSLSLSIAAASVVAKVIRDDIMREMDVLYPQYGFARHKGYGSAAHMQALLEHGPCPIHRRTFRPVREAQDIRERAGKCMSAGRE